MPDPTKPLQHSDFMQKDDATLRQEARDHVARAPALQLVAELLTTLRSLSFSWWTPYDMRRCWGAGVRMAWLRERADLRQEITTQLTGFHRNAARKRPSDFQAAMIDSVIDEGDVTPNAFDEAFAPLDMVVYGPAGEFWHEFRSRMPWGDDCAQHQELIGWLILALMSEESSIDGLGRRKPILTAFEVRNAIDGKVWQTRVPVELRAAIDDARLEHERTRPSAPFHAKHDLAIVTPELLARHIPLRQLLPVLDAAERNMGFSTRTQQTASKPKEASKPAQADALTSVVGVDGTIDGAAEDGEPATPRPVPGVVVEAQGAEFPVDSTPPDAERRRGGQVIVPGGVSTDPRRKDTVPERNGVRAAPARFVTQYAVSATLPPKDPNGGSGGEKS